MIILENLNMIPVTEVETSLQYDKMKQVTLPSSGRCQYLCKQHLVYKEDHKRQGSYRSCYESVMNPTSSLPSQCHGNFKTNEHCQCYVHGCHSRVLPDEN